MPSLRRIIPAEPPLKDFMDGYYLCATYVIEAKLIMPSERECKNILLQEYTFFWSVKF